MAKTKKARKQIQKKRQKASAAKRNFKPRKPISIAVRSSDLQELLVEKILAGDVVAENGTAIENLIYNATPRMADVGYSFGFSVGREMALKRHADGDFTRALDRIGLHRALYYPFNDRLIITSVPTKHVNKNLNHSIHVFEAGVISGYLSVTTGLKMQTRESLCIHNGANVCQFVSTPLATKAVETRPDINSIIDAISHSITNNRYKRLNNEYYRILSYLPLLEHPMSEQVRKLLLISGKRMAEYSSRNDMRRVINNIANYFGARSENVSIRQKGKSIIKLRYSNYNSIYPYIALPTALITGFASSALNKEAELSVLTNNDRTYTTIIELKDKSE